jgi:hypothetical protein
MMEPYNPPYYPALWETFGFRVLSTYYSRHVPDVSSVVPQLEPLYERAVKSGIVFRPFNPRRYDEELDILYDMTCRIFPENPYYSDIPKEAFKQLYAGAKPIIDPKLFWFCVDQEGRHVGFIFSFPDYFQSLCSMKGKTHALAKLRFLLNKKKAHVLNLKTVGIYPGLRGTGLGAALMYKAYHEGFLKGYSKANLCLFHQDNKSGTIDGGQGDIMRTYRLYEY